MTTDERTLFDYQFVVNLDSYEPKLTLGMNIYELMGAGMAFIVPLLVGQTIVSLLLGVIAAVTVLLCLKRSERLGNIALPLYLLKRAQLAYRPEPLTLPHLVSRIEATVTVMDYEGEHIATYG